MANIKTFSSVTIRDYSDLGQVMLYLTSNQPTTVTYNPNTSVYNPNWGTSNLVITPVIQYNGTTLANNASGMTITYKRKDGSNTATNLTTGESASSGVLTVSQNKIGSSTSGILTYICHVAYTDPNVGVTVEAESSMTFTLISQPTELKSAFITGENAFLYNSDRNLVSTNPIVLTANLNNVTVNKWQYKSSASPETWTDFPLTYNASNTGNTLIVDARESNIWINNGRTASIRLLTSDNNINDTHEMMKIYDGAAGNASLVVQLSNQTHYVPCDSSGNVTSWNGSSTRVYIYEGGTDVTSSWTITPHSDNHLTGTYDNTTNTYSPSSLDVDTGYCDFECTKSGYSSITVRYTITKTRMGADGVSPEVYQLHVEPLTINKDKNGNFTNTVSCYATKIIGNTETAYSGRFKIYESTNGSTYGSTPVYASATDESSKTNISPSSSTVKLIKIELYQAGGGATAIDSQIVVITNDGQDGAQGDPGLNGVSMGLGNYQDILPCKANGYTSQAMNITIPFYAYAGITRIPVTASVGSLPSGITISSNTAGSASGDGTLILAVANNSALGNASTITGGITITLTCSYNNQSQSIAQQYTYTKNVAAKDAVLFEIYTPYSDGNIIRNSTGSVTLNTRMVSGTTDVTPTSIQWAKYQSGNYVDISGATSTSLVVYASDVDDMAFYRATAVYNGVSYVAYQFVDDVVDPYSCVLRATVTEFKNSQGHGAIYAQVFQNGVEIDPIKKMGVSRPNDGPVFSNTPPSNPQSGDFYYHLDTTNKKCILKKYNGSSWSDVSSSSSDANTLVYKYFRTDLNGASLDTGGVAYTQNSNQTKAIYIDPSLINTMMQYTCEVYP